MGHDAQEIGRNSSPRGKSDDGRSGPFQGSSTARSVIRRHSGQCLESTENVHALMGSKVTFGPMPSRHVDVRHVRLTSPRSPTPTRPAVHKVDAFGVKDGKEMENQAKVTKTVALRQRRLKPSTGVPLAAPLETRPKTATKTSPNRPSKAIRITTGSSALKLTTWS